MAGTIHIHLVTSISGFPNGTAATKRVKMIGKAILRSGTGFTVYTNSLASNRLNTEANGSFHGISFHYLHGTTDLDKGKIKKAVLFLKGILHLKKVLAKLNPGKDIVYIDAQGTLFNVIAIHLSRKYKLKVIEEVNEWFHNELRRPLEKIINEGPMLQSVEGAVVCSTHINDMVLSINPKLKTLVVPVLEDPWDYPASPSGNPGEQYCFWMGQVDGYLDDVLFIIEALGLARQRGMSCDLLISGPCKKSVTREAIVQKAAAMNLPDGSVRLLGYISEEALLGYCQKASFFVVPLWDNERSAARFPTKVASFMFSGKPVFTCRVGELGELLTDRKNVLFYFPGDSRHLADLIVSVSQDPTLYQLICTNTREFAMTHFDYKRYEGPLLQFCNAILDA